MRLTRYGIALRHDGAGSMPLWTSDGIAPTIETEGGDPARDADSDFSFDFVDTTRGVKSAKHGDTVIALLSNTENVHGMRVTGAALVRDSRFDTTLPSICSAVALIGDRVHFFRWYREAGNNRRLESYAYQIAASSLVREISSDIDIAFNVGGTAPTNAFVHSGKLWVWTQNGSDWHAFAVVGNTATARNSPSDVAGADTFSGQQSGYTRTLAVLGDFVYYPHRVSGNNALLQRFNWTTQAADASEVDLGGAFFTNLVGFGGRVFGFTKTAGATFEAHGVRVEQEFLEWNAPPSDYNTLNTRRQADAGFRVAVMDPDIIGVSVPGAEFVPTPVDVRSVRRITLNGTQEDLGDGETWRFDVARQKLIQDPGATALTAADALVVDYAARAIAQACNPGAAVMRDDFADLRDSDGLAFDDALETAEAFLDRYGTLTDRLSIEIRDHAESAREAETVQFDTTILRALGLTDAAERRPVANLRRSIPVGRRHPDPAGGVPARGVPGTVRGLVARAGRRRVEATQPPCYDPLMSSGPDGPKE